MSFASLRHRLSLRLIALVSFSVAVASAPLYIVRWHYGPVPTTLLETLILISVALYAMTLWSERAWPRRTPLDIPIAILLVAGAVSVLDAPSFTNALGTYRAEEHTSELQSRQYLVCRLLLEKKKIYKQITH